jgi:hypothetical protein
MAGAAYDVTGSYRVAFLISAALNLLVVALLAASTRVRRGGGMSGRAILRRTITAAGERR